MPRLEKDQVAALRTRRETCSARADGSAVEEQAGDRQRKSSTQQFSHARLPVLRTVSERGAC